MTTHPTISIVTPVLNGAAMLCDAAASLKDQPVSFEHIVVDGGSTDGTQKVALSSGATLVEAPGSSLYEALNLGMQHVRGDLCGLLNSDDLLQAGALSHINHAFAADPGLELIKGRALEYRWANGTWSTGGDSAAPSLTLRATLLEPPRINACYAKTAFWRRVGPFETAYSIASDREWLARAILSRPRARIIDRTLYIYRAHEKSMTIGGGKAATERWVREHLVFAEHLMSDTGLTVAERGDVYAFHAKETVHALVLAMRRGDWGAISNLAVSSFRRAPLWPLEAVSPLSSVLLKRLRRTLSP